jgi:hypothetical protein
MNVLPALSLIVTDAIRAQFSTTGTREPDRAPSFQTRVALAAALEWAARAVAPTGYRPAH